VCIPPVQNASDIMHLHIFRQGVRWLEETFVFMILWWSCIVRVHGFAVIVTQNVNVPMPRISRGLVDFLSWVVPLEHQVLSINLVFAFSFPPPGCGQGSVNDMFKLRAKSSIIGDFEGGLSPGLKLHILVTGS
jgi:hypothetical protein